MRDLRRAEFRAGDAFSERTPLRKIDRGHELG
jgi:hypothetical protein